MEQLDAKIEGILFAMGEPVERSALAMALEITEKEVEVRLTGRKTGESRLFGWRIPTRCVPVSPAMTHSSGLLHDQESRCSRMS